MDPILLLLPIAIGSAACDALADGYPPKQAIARSVRAVSPDVWKRVPDKETAGAIGRMAFRSSLEQCPELWRQHQKTSRTSRPLFSL